MECKLPKKDHTSMKHMTIALLSILILVSCCACGQEAAAESMPTWQEHYDLGVRYLSEGNYDEAIIAFTAAIEIDPKRPEAYLSLADAYTGAGAMNAARKALEDGFAATGGSGDSDKARRFSDGGRRRTIPTATGGLS